MFSLQNMSLGFIDPTLSPHGCTTLTVIITIPTFALDVGGLGLVKIQSHRRIKRHYKLMLRGAILG